MEKKLIKAKDFQSGMILFVPREPPLKKGPLRKIENEDTLAYTNREILVEPEELSYSPEHGNLILLIEPLPNEFYSQTSGWKTISKMKEAHITLWNEGLYYVFSPR